MPKVKILVDECLDRRLAKEIKGFYAKTVPQMGWAGLTNGKLLTQAQDHFDVFITSDQNLSFQQNLIKYNMTIIVLCPRRNQLSDLLLLVPALMEVLSKSFSRQVIYIKK